MLVAIKHKGGMGEALHHEGFAVKPQAKAIYELEEGCTKVGAYGHKAGLVMDHND